MSGTIFIPFSLEGAEIPSPADPIARLRNIVKIYFLCQNSVLYGGVQTSNNLSRINRGNDYRMTIVSLAPIFFISGLVYA